MIKVMIWEDLTLQFALNFRKGIQRMSILVGSNFNLQRVSEFLRKGS